MSSRTENVARNLTRIRKEQKLSLENVAAMTGISRSMIGQIERGQTNPTIHVVEKLADGLRIDFFELLDKTPSEYILWKHGDHSPQKEVEGCYRVTENFEKDDCKKFHMFSVDMSPGMNYQWEIPLREPMIFLRVEQGSLSVGSAERRFEMEEGDELRFHPSGGFSLSNRGGCECRCLVAYNN